MHDTAGVSITIAAILATSFSNNQAVNGLRSEMNALRSQLMGRFDLIQRDMRDLYAGQARHNLRISTLEQHHKQ